MSDYNSLWAKDNGESLLDHTLNVISVAKSICNNLPFSKEEINELLRALIIACVFHDAGKAADGFQNALREKKAWGYRHEILSTSIANELYPDMPKECLFAILTHHRCIPKSSIVPTKEKCLPFEELPSFDDEINPKWNEAINELRKNLYLLNAFFNELIKKGYIPEINALLPETLDFDGLGLPEVFIYRDFQKKKINEEVRIKSSILRGLLISSDHMASSGLNAVPEIPKFSNYPIIEKEIKGFLRPFQKKTSDTIGDAILKAPTGSGKTGAALLWAAKNQQINSRLFYVLPYTASINAMYKRLQNIFATESVGILHHKNLAFLYQSMEDDDDQKEESARQRSNLSHEIYHPIRVCTPHQILRVALQGKGWEHSIVEFRNACFIFDEIHAYDPLITGLTIATVKWLKSMNAKVLFATATLPKYIEELLKNELMLNDSNILSPNSSIEGDREICKKIRHEISIRDGNIVEDLENIANEIKKNDRKYLLICNHVATSQIIYKKLTEDYRIDATLFHARFNSHDRTEIENAITSKNPPKVLIATQAIEVSLDINYDIGFIEPAPADAIGQRLGRINRSGNNKYSPAKIVIYSKIYDKNKIYNEKLVNNTVENLRSVSLLTEQQLTDIVNIIYQNGYEGDDLEDYNRGLNHPIINNFNKEIIAGTYREWIENIISNSDGVIDVLPNSLSGTYLRLLEQKKFIEAKMLFVPIRVGQKFWTMKKGLLKYSDDLKEYVIFTKYDSKTGLNLTDIDNIF
ncbi:MAG: CRISPR-associated helicase Cas3' [Candidatus Methanoperedens sp.]|nr:CRISPR-associated helicase Cas3' [Candidatus Methanoperedens sp.]MCZ7406503.1 CRISPR-associated helicase Cas3' [Candidatus Methanoperedens sp.]